LGPCISSDTSSDNAAVPIATIEAAASIIVVCIVFICFGRLFTEQHSTEPVLLS